MSGLEVTETPDSFQLRVLDADVTACTVDYALTLVVGGSGDQLYLTVEQPFWFRPDEDGLEVRFDPGTEPGSLKPVLAVLHRSVDEIVVQKDGLLEVRFALGGSLRVPPSDQFEAWNIVGSEGLRFVSMPGGELATWKPRGNAE